MTQTQTKSLLGGAFILLECLFWGTGNPLITLMDGVIPNFLLLGIRFGCAFVLLMAIFGKRIVAALRKCAFRPLLVSAAYTALAYILSNFGLRLTSATFAGFLIALPVLFTPILAFFLYRQRMRAVMWFPIALVIAGLFLMCGTAGGFGFGIGEGLALLSSAVSAMMLLSSAKALETTDPMAITAVQFGFSAVSCLLCALLFEDVTVLVRVPAWGWGCVAYLVVCTSFLAFILQNLGLQRVSSMHASLLMCSEPVFTAVTAYFVLHETLTLTGFIGAGCIMASLVMATFLSESKA